MSKEVFDFSAGIKKKLAIAFISGVVLLLAGWMLSSTGGHEEEHSEDDHTELAEADDHGTDHDAAETMEAEHHEGDDGHVAEAGEHEAEEEHEKGWFDRVVIDLWINNVYFTGLALIGLFFFAIQYAAQAGWSTYILRIPLSMASWILPAGILMLLTFLFFNHDIFHWTHSDLYNEFNADGSLNTHFDSLVAGKASFFYAPLDAGTFPVFFVGRMVVFFGAWILLFRKLRSLSNLEDQLGGTSYWYKMRRTSVAFLLIFAVSSSIAAWDWIMSIDVHWFSTMFGWYVFASWFVAGLALITLITVLLKENGYLTQVTSNHLHDLGKFVFAFSIFWTYIWFSQFLLIYYANIPEESVYFVERMMNDKYSTVFYVNLIMNFFFPFLVLITRDAKRLNVFLKIACIVIILGHWVDFYLMVTPGTLGESGAFGLTEIGLYLVFGSAFLFVVLKALSSYALVPKNHPMLEEAKNHHI